MLIRWASLCSQLSRTPTRGRRPECISWYGLARSVLLIVFTTWIEISYSESSYTKPNTGRYLVCSRDPMRRWCIVDTGTSFYRYLFWSFFSIIHALLLLCTYCSTTRSSEEEQVNPWGSWNPRTPRTPHESLRIIARLDSRKGHLIRNRQTGPGWISFSIMGAFFPKIGTYQVPGIWLLPILLFSGGSQPAFLVAHYLIRCQYLTISFFGS